MGITAALVFGNFGAAYGTAKSGVGVCSAVVLKPELLFKSIIPIVMAGILGIYGLIVAVLFNGESKCQFNIFLRTCFRDQSLIFWSHHEACGPSKLGAPPSKNMNLLLS